MYGRWECEAGMSLTTKQQRFVEEYMVDFNATQAAIRAGYSKKTADVIGCENLGKPKIAKAIAERGRKLTEKADVTTTEIVEGLKREANREDDDATHSARVSAWAHLGKYRGMFTDRTENRHVVEVVVRSE